MHELWKQVSEILSDVQSLAHELHSAKLEHLGVVGAMKGLCREFGDQHKMKIDFRSHDLPSTLPAEVSLSLFRVLQESLHNTVKHSGVRHVDVELGERSAELHLTVNDLGRGFDIHSAKESPGLGLTSMQERLRLVNGELSIESQPKRALPFTPVSH